jgi:coenzyme F420-reducing hydrogenase delta subunit/NAD-dependent dihydropyrimidine dehydrogenase PreA subunit
MQYPSNIRVIRVPCTSKVDITYILRAFEVGVDGIIIAGCLEGGCHFVEGNIRAKVRVNFTKELLNAIGFEGDRLEMFNLSASMGPRFVEIVNEMTDRIKALGPSRINRRSVTQKTLNMNKREFLYRILGNLSLKKPEKPILVPEGLIEFGSIECNLSECIGCKRCMEVCPEEAIDFVDKFDLSSVLKDLAKSEGRITKRHLLYKTIAQLAITEPSGSFSIPEGKEEFSKFLYKPERCVLCDKCSKICPENAISVIRKLFLSKILDSLGLTPQLKLETNKIPPKEMMKVVSKVV